MTSFKKVLLAMAMTGLLSLGFMQLSMAAITDCPTYACNELWLCDISIHTTDTCYKNGQQYWIHPVISCPVSSCYDQNEW